MEDDAGTTADICGYQEDKSLMNFEELRPPVDALDYLKSVYCDPLQPTHTRLKAASIAIEYERPRLAVNAQIEGRDLATMLDRANGRIAKLRSEPQKVETEKVKVDSIADILDPPQNPPVKPLQSIPDKRYRR